MLLIPAIDIRGGRCVRLYQGDFDQETVFADDPVAVAQRWVAQGARLLHLVDLDGARAGRPVNHVTVRAIAATAGAPVQVGGGVRDLDAANTLLQAGVARVVLGTAAVKDRDLVRAACQRWGDRIVVGLDAREGLVATDGWVETSAVRAVDLARDLAEEGVGRFIYTDIHRDGTLTEPNYAALAELLAATPCPVVASGGIASSEHLLRLADLGVEAAIVGRALYTGDLSLTAALSALGKRGE